MLERASKERVVWAVMPARWIRASVLDDLVQAGLDCHEQIIASLPPDDGLFAFPILLLTDRKLSPALEEDLSLQTGCSLDMCTVEDSAREPGAEKLAQQPERPVEATEYPLEEDRSSLEPPGQEA
ncbi:hypothetical protein PAMA_014805 [Pampus argenteus]